MKWISYSQIRTHIWTFLRENSPERCIQSAREWRKHLHFSDDSSERLWLVFAFISSTESCVIGYNAVLYASVSGSAPASERKFEFSSWWYDALNDLITPVWLYYIQKILIGYFLSFGSCIQNPLGSKIWGGTCPLTLNGHDASVYMFEGENVQYECIDTKQYWQHLRYLHVRKNLYE